LFFVDTTSEFGFDRRKRGMGGNGLTGEGCGFRLDSTSEHWFIIVCKDSPIKVGKFEGFSWIRCEGKGSFMNSLAVKEFGEARIDAGVMRLVIDLEKCVAMDSTFMGTLAGMANRIKEQGGKLQVTGASDKSRNSLEDLGLDFLMEINVDDEVWADVRGQARDLLKEKVAGVKAGTVMRARHVLEAHEVLSEANEANEKKFSEVVKLLEEELAVKAGQTC
jgi:anti-sigma B factor antagonist